MTAEDIATRRVGEVSFDFPPSSEFRDGVDEPYETAVVIACVALLGAVTGGIAYIALMGI
jgi:hypothetical protein